MADGVATWDATFGLVDLMLDAIRTDITSLQAELGLIDVPPDTSPDVGTLKADVGVLKSDVATLKTNVSTLQTNVSTLQTSVNTLNTNVSTLQTDVNTLKTSALPITFVFGGVPAVNSMINVPLTMNLSITSANLTASKYYNAVNPASASTFRLSRIPSGGTMTTIGTVSVNTSGQGSFSGTGSTALVAGDTLRMTAITVGTDLTDVSISIQSTRR